MTASAPTPNSEPPPADPRDEPAKSADVAPADATPDPLAPALRAFELGDYVVARRAASSLLSSDDKKLRARAETLVGQLGPDRVVVAVMLFTAFLIAILGALYVGAR